MTAPLDLAAIRADYANEEPATWRDLFNACDEIERLRAENADMKDEVDALDEERGLHACTVDRMRPVVEAAMALNRVRALHRIGAFKGNSPVEEAFINLDNAVAAYEASQQEKPKHEMFGHTQECWRAIQFQGASCICKVVQPSPAYATAPLASGEGGRGDATAAGDQRVYADSADGDFCEHNDERGLCRICHHQKAVNDVAERDATIAQLRAENEKLARIASPEWKDGLLSIGQRLGENDKEIARLRALVATKNAALNAAADALDADFSAFSERLQTTHAKRAMLAMDKARAAAKEGL